MTNDSWWYKTASDSEWKRLLQRAMQHAALGLSEMVGQSISIDVPHVELLPLNHIMTHVGDPEIETVGIYLLIEGNLAGQILLMFPLHEAFYLVDLLLGQTAGTTAHLGDLERSALAEAGNLTASYFLNEVANLTAASSRPSPPAVLVDMLGAIVDVIVAPVAPVCNELLMAKTVFQESGRTVLGYFWVLPSPVELRV